MHFNGVLDFNYDVKKNVDSMNLLINIKFSTVNLYTKFSSQIEMLQVY